MKREIVSKQYRHNGGHLHVHCSGCRTEEYAAGMAPALGKLVAHVDK